MDELCRCEFASNMPGPAFSGVGRAVLILRPAVPRVGDRRVRYAVYRFLQRRPSADKIGVAWAATAVVDMVMEMPGTLAGTFRNRRIPPLSRTQPNECVRCHRALRLEDCRDDEGRSRVARNRDNHVPSRNAMIVKTSTCFGRTARKRVKSMPQTSEF
jgi:hypothetical protein